MNVTFTCSQCDSRIRQDVASEATSLKCSSCGGEVTLPVEGWEDGQLKRCLVCPSTELFTRKNFPQGLGVTLVVIGIVVSTIPWYFRNWILWFSVLSITAVIDLLLYCFVGNLLQCYRCHAQYRGLSDIDEHEGFHLEIHERYRQQAARLPETADASETADVSDVTESS